MKDLRIPKSAIVTLKPRLPGGDLSFSSSIDALVRQVQFDPLLYVRRHICGDWGDVRSEYRRSNDATVPLAGYPLSPYAVSDDMGLGIFTEADRRLATAFLLNQY